MFDAFKTMLGLHGRDLSPQETLQRIQDGARVVDVREVDEFTHGSIPHAVNVPLSRIERQGASALLDAGIAVSRVEVVLVCRSGARSSTAIQQLKPELGPRGFNLQGGLMAWVGAGLPVHRANH